AAGLGSRARGSGRPRCRPVATGRDAGRNERARHARTGDAARADADTGSDAGSDPDAGAAAGDTGPDAVAHSVPAARAVDEAGLGLRRQEPRPHRTAERDADVSVLNPTTPTLHEAPTASVERPGKQVVGGPEIL